MHQNLLWIIVKSWIVSLQTLNCLCYNPVDQVNYSFPPRKCHVTLCLSLVIAEIVHLGVVNLTVQW